MKKFISPSNLSSYLLLLLSTLALTACAGKPHDLVTGDPKLDFRGNERFARVGSPYKFSMFLLGRMPSKETMIELEITYNGGVRSRGTGYMASRFLPSSKGFIRLNFSPEDYYEARYVSRKDAASRDLFEDPTSIASFDSDSKLYLKVSLFIVEPHPYKPGVFNRIKLWAKGAWMIYLSCPQCMG